ncbi:NAD(P)H-quinone oxidoreductase [Albibacterium sp.]|uniref:NAD(P)H-quinone oxidoreductase n=1 Tax=Albibacterium sp. TaxID=2952885 RepID=UPI002BCD2ECF|nr:NAD(P)H-quinone oxidoreductase [Albibacterium sp.]HUH17922.1 NAD(P)H-quinone oxidoreductase [Albibacterium sp.]
MIKGIIYKEPGGVDVLTIVEMERPECKDNEVLIKVVASGVNKPDIFQRKGNYNAPAGVVQNILGLEVSGVIEECGKGVARWKVGDQVCALLAGGGYSSCVVVDENHCLPKPANLSFVEAASLPEVIFTVWHNLFQRGGLLNDDRILIHGGSGGIGVAAIQLASIFGHQVYVTAGNDDKCQKCIDLGATVAINYNTEDFEGILKSNKVDVILDSIGGSYFEKNINILRTDGRLIYINAVKGANVQLNIGKIMKERLTISGSTLRNRDAQFKADLANEIERNVWPKIEDGLYKPVIYKSFSYDNVAIAHQLMERGIHFGKIVLEW